MAPPDENKIKAAEEYLESLPEDQRKKILMDNQGNMTVNNRRYRRSKDPDNPSYTKKTNTKRKKRAKTNGKTKH